MIENPFRPSFLVRRLLLAVGAQASNILPDPELERFNLHDPKTVEQIWTDLEPLVFALTLAGYDCHGVWVATPWGGNPITNVGCVYLDVLNGAAIYAPYDWRDFTGLNVDASVYSVLLLSITVRRTYGVAPKHPPIPLELDPTILYRNMPDSNDKLFDPLDGFVAVTSSEPKLPHQIAAVAARPVTAKIITLLVDEWSRASTSGLLPCLNPEGWELPGERDVPAEEFRTLATQVWQVLGAPGEMRRFLEAPLSHGDGSLERLMTKMQGIVAIPAAQAALSARAVYAHGNQANLQLLLEQKTMFALHWGYFVFVLHEFGLIRILPFPLPFKIGIEHLDLTGSYESVAVPFEPGLSSPLIATMQLHQSGEFLEGWWYDDQLQRWDISSWRAPGRQGAGKLAFPAIFRRGDQIKDVEFEDIPDTDETWTNLAFDVKFNGTTYRMKRGQRRAKVPPDVRLGLQGAGAPAELEAHFAQMHWLSSQGLSEARWSLIVAIDHISGVSKAEWPAEISSLEAELRRKLANDSVYRYSIGNMPETPILAVLRSYFRSGLLAHNVAETNLNGWTQLRQILTALDAVADPTSPVLRALLQISVDAPHTYTFQWAGIGGAAGGGLFFQGEAGTWEFGGDIRHHDSCAPADVTPAQHGWSSWYFGQLGELMGGFGWSAGVGVSVVMGGSPNDIVTEEEWSRDDFGPDKSANPFSAPTCWFVIGSYGLSAGGGYYVQGDVGYDAGERYYFFNRTRMAVASGKGDGVNWSAGVGISAGYRYYGEGTWGTILGRTSTRLPTIDSSSTAKALTWRRSEDVTFRTNRYKLTSYGREVLARFVARNRAFFESPTAVVVIEADATPLGDAAYNESLSWKRALHVYETIRTLLAAPASGRFGISHGLAIGEDRLRIVANGEIEAQLHGVPEGADPEDWRRTKVLLDSKILLTL